MACWSQIIILVEQVTIKSYNGLSAYQNQAWIGSNDFDIKWTKIQWKFFQSKDVSLLKSYAVSSCLPGRCANTFRYVDPYIDGLVQDCSVSNW